MTLLWIIPAVLLCGVATLASYVHLLFVHSLPIRARENPATLKHFEEELRPRLGMDSRQGLFRFALARQLALVALVLVLTLLFVAEGGGVSEAIGEAAILAVTAVIFFVHIVPSLLLRRTSGRWLESLLPVAKLIGWVTKPFALLVHFVSSVAELSAEEPRDNGATKPGENIEALLDAGEEEGLIGQEDRQLIQSVVEFGDKTVREVVTPRPRVVAIEAGRTVEELWQLLIDREISRVPVFEEDIDNIVGLVHTRDTLDIDESQGKLVLVRELMRPVALVPETKPIHELLRQMQENNAQMSIVIDEYGQTAGLVTMEDLMEEIVGEIHDESDSPSDVIEQPDHSFILDGNVDLDRLDGLVGFRPDEEIESITIGGLVCEHLGKVPAPGAKVALDGIQIEVLSGDQRKVSSVRIRRVAENAEVEPGPPEKTPSEASAEASE